MTIKRIFLLLCTAAAVAHTTQAQKISVKKGLKLESVTVTKMTMEVMGQNIDNETNMTSSLEVKDVNSDGYLFSNLVKHIVIKGNAMGQDISFDSDKKEDMDGQVGQALKDHVGVSQDIQVDKKGKVLSTTDSSKKAGGMSDMMSVTGDVTKGQPYPMLIQLPAKTVKPGDSWTDSSGTDATIKTVTTYTLKSISGDGVLVSFTGTLSKSGTIEQSGMEIQMDMTGAIKGESTYEPGSGLLKTSTSSSDIKGTLGVMGQNAPISATVTANIVTKKL